MVAMNSFFTIDEWAAVFDKWPGNLALAYNNVSQTQLSIARYYGGIKINGNHYTYMPTDELIRDDVLKFVTKLRKAKKAEPTATQQELPT